MPLVYLMFTLLTTVSGRVLDPQGQAVAGATVRLAGQATRTGAQGAYRFMVVPGRYTAAIEAPGIAPAESLVIVAEANRVFDLRFEHLAGQRESVVVSAKTPEPSSLQTVASGSAHRPTTRRL